MKLTTRCAAFAAIWTSKAEGDERKSRAGVPKEWRDWSFRLPAESGYEVDFAMKDGKVERLVLRDRRVGDAATCQRTVNLVLPDGSKVSAIVDRALTSSTFRSAAR